MRSISIPYAPDRQFTRLDDEMEIKVQFLVGVVL